jgi:DNA (cytosine-5)-methyltransferase 1
MTMWSKMHSRLLRGSAKSVISLFAGAGGLDLGLEAAGFDTRLCVEIDEDARATLHLNRPDWKIAEPGDIHRIEPTEILRQAGLRPGQTTLLAGGPPCQPFSKSGYWSRGDSGRLKDPRANTLKAYLRIVEVAMPKVFVLENVKGLAFDGKDEGLRLLKRQIAAINRRTGSKYNPQVIHINAASYGIPQRRERIFVVAQREGVGFVLPRPTHGPGAEEPYMSTWDAIGDLDLDRWPEELEPTGKWTGLLPSIPEGKNYLWHTPRCGGAPLFGWRTRFWSFLLKLAKSEPSWTIQAVPGPATGPFHWRSRLLSIKELCRLQTFPDGYHISGDRRAAHRQIGNAVPCALAEMLGLEICRQLLGELVRTDLTLIPSRRRNSPPPEPRKRVASQDLPLRRRRREHPGTGRGPGARKRLTA